MEQNGKYKYHTRYMKEEDRKQLSQQERWKDAKMIGENIEAGN